MDWDDVFSDVDMCSDLSCKKRVKPKDKALTLPTTLRFKTHPWSWAMDIDQIN